MDLAMIAQRVEALERKHAVRVRDARLVRLLRDGEWEKIQPGVFSDEFPGPMVANRVAVMAADVAATLSPLPSITCTTSSTLKEAPKAFADKRTKIANGYVTSSDLAAAQRDFADSLNCGLGVYYVEADPVGRGPRIRVEDGSEVLPVWDRAMRTVAVARVRRVEFLDLVAMYEDRPGVVAMLRKRQSTSADGDTVKVVKYADTRCVVVYLPDCGNHVLEMVEHKLGRCPYVCVPRPGSGGAWTGKVRGAYDDLVYPQLAAHAMNSLFLEAVDKSVRAPIAVPTDVTDIALGPDAVIRTTNPSGVRRVDFEVPREVVGATEMLNRDMAVGGMSPESRTGNIQASVITGKGIEAASAGYSTQIAQYQILMAYALREAIAICFVMDEALWPDVDKELRGMDSGTPFSVRYRPSRDIAGDQTVDVSYGFLSGMAANNALVFILQAISAGLVSRDFAARQLPFGFNVGEEFRKMDVESLRNSLLQSISALGQFVPQMVASGQDPSQVVQQLAAVIEATQKGVTIEEAVKKAFAPEPAEPDPGLPPGAAPDEAVGGAGAPQQFAGTPSLGPNDRPDLAMLFAGVNGSGKSVLQAGVSRMDPVRG